jgi:alkylation response protein AidB-like acyl-CoA dehydrogenase
VQYQLDEQQQAFHDEVQSFVSANLPLEVAAKVKRGEGASAAETAAWTTTLNDQGWVAPSWPAEHGGPGWNLMQRHIFDVVCRQAHAPAVNGASFNMVGPAICKYGTPEMQADLLPRILSGELHFCQGYSEPQAGSDLASLGMRADKDGDDYILNGQKIWTSGAENSNWIFLLVRTNHDVQQQKGISFLLADMNTQGVTVQPLCAFNGKRLWNHVFFDDVRVPMSLRLGEEDQGWTVAKSLLGDKRILSVLKDTTTEMTNRGVSLPDSLMAEMAEIEVRLHALEMTSLRVLTEADSGGQIGAEPSMLKLKGSQLIQDQDEIWFRLVDHLSLAMDTKGSERTPLGPAFAEYVASGRYHHRGYTIAGGSSEVQQNIIAKQVLSL